MRLGRGGRVLGVYVRACGFQLSVDICVCVCARTHARGVWGVTTNADCSQIITPKNTHTRTRARVGTLTIAYATLTHQKGREGWDWDRAWGWVWA